MEKLLFIGNNSGGMFDFRGMLLSELVKRGYDVVVVTPFDTNVEDLRKLGVKLLQISLDRRGKNPLNEIALYRKLAKVIKKENPSMVVAYTIKPNIYAGLYCKKKGIRFFFGGFGIFAMQEQQSKSLRVEHCSCYSHGDTSVISPWRSRIEHLPSIATMYELWIIRSIIASEIGLSVSSAGWILQYQPSVSYCVQNIIERFSRASMISNRS